MKIRTDIVNNFYELIVFLNRMQKAYGFKPTVRCNRFIQHGQAGANLVQGLNEGV